MEPRPKPLIGALLGALLGVVVMALLWMLGIAPPDRLPLFGLVSVGILLGGSLLTLLTRAAKARLTVVVVLAAVLAGVALTGIPEYVRGGSVSQVCTVQATSSVQTEPLRPSQTFAYDPFDVTATDTIEWQAGSTVVLTDWDTSLALMVGGFAIPVWHGGFANELGADALEGAEPVEPRLAALTAQLGVPLTGTFHLQGTLRAAEADCSSQGYVRVVTDGAAPTVTVIALWALLAVIVVVLLVLMISVVRSMRRRPEPTPDGPEGVPAQESTPYVPPQHEGGDATKPLPQRRERDASPRSGDADSSRRSGGDRSSTSSRSHSAASHDSAGSHAQERATEDPTASLEDQALTDEALEDQPLADDASPAETPGVAEDLPTADDGDAPPTPEGGAGDESSREPDAGDPGPGSGSSAESVGD